MSGTAQIFPVVGSNFNLPTPLPTKDAADGTPGTTAPTIAIQVGGKDTNGNLEAVQTDVNGVQAVSGKTPAPIIIQKANGVVASGTSVAVAFPNAVKAGNAIVVCMGIGSASGSLAINVTDTVNNAYQLAQVAQVQGMTMAILWTLGSIAGANTVTLAWTGSFAGAMEIYEVSGIGRVNTSVAQESSAGTTSVSLPVSPLSDNELAFMVLGAGAGTISATTPASPSNISFDSGNLATSGSVLVNFGAFSALVSAPLSANSATALFTDYNYSMNATIGSSVAVAGLALSFIPSVAQVSGYVGVLANRPSLGDGESNQPWMSATQGSQTSINATPVLANVAYSFLYNGSTWDRQRVPSLFGSGSITGASSPAPILKLQSTVGLRLMRYKIALTSNLAVTNAGVFPIYLVYGTPASSTVAFSPQYASGQNIGGIVSPLPMHQVYIPSTAGALVGPGWDSGWIDLGNGILSNASLASTEALQVCINGPLGSTTVAPTATFGSSTLFEGIWIAFKTAAGIANAGVPVRLLQSSSIIGAAAATQTLSTLLPTTPGSTLIVVAVSNQNTTAPSISTDTQGLTWHTVTESNGSTQQIMVSYCNIGSCKGGAETVTVSVSPTSTGVSKVQIYEYMGLITAADATTASSKTTGTSTTYALGASASVAATSDFIFAAVGTATSATFTAGTLSTSFEQLLLNADGNGTLLAADNLNSVPAGFVGMIDVQAAACQG